METYLPVIWAGVIGTRRRDLRHPRRLRSRHRHPVSACEDRSRARPDDEFGRAVLGRQRDLARARRRRIMGRLPAGLRGDHAGHSTCRSSSCCWRWFFAASPSNSVRSRVTSKTYWNFAFAAGSTIAAFCQGVILGGLIQGIKVENGVFAGGAFDWATPFAVLCGLGVMVGYALLGATWLVMKTEGAVAERARDQAKRAAARRARFMAIVSIWTPLAFERIAARWFSLPEHPIPLVGTAAHRARRTDGLALARGGTRDPSLPRVDRPVPARAISAS